MQAVASLASPSHAQRHTDTHIRRCHELCPVDQCISSYHHLPWSGKVQERCTCMGERWGQGMVEWSDVSGKKGRGMSGKDGRLSGVG